MDALNWTNITAGNPAAGTPDAVATVARLFGISTSVVITIGAAVLLFLVLSRAKDLGALLSFLLGTLILGLIVFVVVTFLGIWLVPGLMK